MTIESDIAAVSEFDRPCEYCGEKIVDHTPIELWSCVSIIECRTCQGRGRLCADDGHGGLAEIECPDCTCPPEVRAQITGGGNG